jgi:hypothetical protein
MTCISNVPANLDHAFYVCHPSYLLYSSLSYR